MKSKRVGGYMKKIIVFIAISYVLCFGQVTGYFYADSAGAGALTGVDWSNMFDRDSLKHFLETHVVAGNVVYIRNDGSMTFAANIDFSAIPGTAISPIMIRGVKAGTTRTDSNIINADLPIDSADRPLLINGSAYQFRTGNYCNVSNLRFVGQNVSNLQMGTNCKARNCFVYHNQGTAAGEYCANFGASTSLLRCTFQSDANAAVTMAGSGWVENCKFINFNGTGTNGTAFNFSGTGTSLVNCLFANCKRAMTIGAQANVHVSGCTFYNCDSVLTMSTAYSCDFNNNIIVKSTVLAIYQSTLTYNNAFWNNVIDTSNAYPYCTGVDTSSVFRDLKIIRNSPLLIDPANGDFTIPTSSPAYNTAY